MEAIPVADVIAIDGISLPKVPDKNINNNNNNDNNIEAIHHLPPRTNILDNNINIK